jgi:RNA-directed DNA polymerase
MDKTKLYKISKDVVVKAFRRVKTNKGAAGIDDVRLRRRTFYSHLSNSDLLLSIFHLAHK